MVKKRGKRKILSKRRTKKGRYTKQITKNQESEPISKDLHELEILAEKNVNNKIEDIEDEEKTIEKKEDIIIEEEKKIEKETEKLERIEKEIKDEVKTKPLMAINFKDLNKGIIGAFIGVVAHFAFLYGKEVAKEITVTRATVLIIFSYILIIILMYETGYREIKEKRLIKILPRRATAIYLTSILVILIIFFLFNQINLSDLAGLYKQIAVTSVLASLGAGTADLIGRD